MMIILKCGLDVSRLEYNGFRDLVFDELSCKYIFVVIWNICFYVNGFMVSFVVGGFFFWGLYFILGFCFFFCYDFEYLRFCICIIIVLIVGNI